MHIAERTYHYMSRTNTLLDKTLCDVLIEINDLYNLKVFNLDNSEKIFKIGYDASKQAIMESINKKIFSVLCETEDNSQKILLP